MAEFRKILIANRGEIAIRVMRAANEMGKSTVAVFAKEDKLSLHRFKADEAYEIGEALGPVASYLNINEIISVAIRAGADAIHIQDMVYYQKNLSLQKLVIKRVFHSLVQQQKLWKNWEIKQMPEKLQKKQEYL